MATMNAKSAPVIVGAGLAGLIAAHAWPRASIVERGAPVAMHKAVLRFRSEAVADLTGIEFRRVRVHKGLWLAGAPAAPSIRCANLYAQKCLGRLAGERSIWALDPVDRFVAPDTFYEQLLEGVHNRAIWGEDFSYHANRSPVVSTAPLPVVLASLGWVAPVAFERAPITVQRFRIAGADVFQTIYFPGPETDVYRASMTGDVLIVETTGDDLALEELSDVLDAFGLDQVSEPLGTVKQSFGKIAPIDAAMRKNLLFRLTHERNIYSLGRFATYRNILLDDVVADIGHIKRMLVSDSAYDLHRSAT